MRKLAAGLFLLLMISCADNASWQPAGDHIRTKWTKDVTPSNPHPDYPRPGMQRPIWKSLNGLWDYAVTPSTAERMPEPDGKILVPFCIESSLSGVGRNVGRDSVLWYERDFVIPRKWKQHTLLHFDAVDWKAEVWLNGKQLKTHTGGYTRFSYDIASFLVPGKQHLVVKVTDGTDNDMQPRGKQVTSPQGIWYTSVTGIWQSVWIEPVADAYISGYYAETTLGGDIKLSTSIVGEADNVFYRLLPDGGGDCIAEASCTAGDEVVLHIDNPEFWSPETPYLYGLEIGLVKDGHKVDLIKGYTAIRQSSEVRDAAGYRRIGLNGKPYFQFGPLDQGWWPDGLYTAPTDQALKFDIVKTKDFGYNMIRKHIKVEPERWYYWCDRLGICVWQDMPSFSSSKNQWAQGIDRFDTGTDYPVTPEIRDNYYKEWGEIIAQLKKFPCIVMWVPFNEAWGQFETREVVAFTREQDPSRLINPASGGNWPSATGDVVDSHHYPQPYMRLWDPELVNVLGEYGGIGRPIEGHLWQKDRNWGYVQYATEEEATDEYVRFAEQLLPFVEQGCSAAVYTQTTDVEGEVNGLMTYDRAIKKLTVDRVSAANRSVIGSLHE